MNAPVVFLLIAILAGTQSQTASGQASCADLAKTVTAISSAQKTMQTQIEELKAQGQKESAQLTEMEASLDQLHQENEDEQVAFSAALDLGDIGIVGPLAKDTILVFKDVTTNVGNDYNPDTGVFTARVNGTYLFLWHVAAFGNSIVAGPCVSLCKNSKTTYMAFETGKDGFQSASQSIALSLQVGDTVDLRIHAYTFVFDDDHDHNTFSGHLLFTM